MQRIFTLAALACAAPITVAGAHAVCGSRIYPVTLTLDDPGVADELTIPQVTYTRSAADGGPGPGHDTTLAFEYDKRLTEEIGLAINDSLGVNQTNGAKTQTGWDDLAITAKWASCLSPDHGFQLGAGVIRTFGHTGTTHTGADTYGNTAPTVYVGKGLDEIPIAALQPLQLSAELSYAVADKGIGTTRVTDARTGLSTLRSNNGNTNQWVGGASVQYPLSYLQNQVKDFGLPEPLAHLIPLVEVDWTSPTQSGGNAPTTWMLAPGFIYLRSWYQIGVEALVPLDRAAGTNVGVAVQLHVFLDDLYPHGIGAPLLALLQ